ncbi:hypothetical protein RMSM_07606 [Rhodopirellula maiorica SM1]|uniref:DUF2271 domain-containing protein n=1 Tax=Rhodopirellula maiorica SM1 TaxID=1265738 RepID=M5R8U2_9BACT|nr:DUF2271 domain-containing protein [Rhodopirellula maiorica]EMI15471.1 hypothetical protein RMSM_07606 [Rhodopirellula maiorica SM1]
MKYLCLFFLSSVCVLAVTASEPDSTKLEVSVEIPQLNVSEYHRPYVAVWVQDTNRKVVANLAVWYQLTGKTEGEGTKWLPDLRQWWRRSGRSLELPVDGVCGATRPAGKHTLQFASNDKRLASLKPGDYVLVIEAAREVGGRELLQIPFTWPTKSSIEEEVAGETELGKVSLSITP